MLEEQVRELVERTTQLETQVVRLRSLVDDDREPFTYLCLETKLTSGQATQILDLMDEAERSIRSGTPMGHHDFERRVYGIVPERDGDYHFAESIVSTLNQERRWREVFKYMQAHGMNIHDRSDDTHDRSDDDK